MVGSNFTGVKPNFSKKSIGGSLVAFSIAIDLQTELILKFAGENFVNDARQNHTYKDRTGNLTSSIGYVVALNGTIRIAEFSGGAESKSEGIKRAREVAAAATRKFGKTGYTLIVFAGMEYAAAVESKGYDVISNSIPATQKLINELNKATIR